MVTELTKAHDGLYQFTDILKPIKLSVHQYLLLTDEPVLVQTGAIRKRKRLCHSLNSYSTGNR